MDLAFITVPIALAVALLLVIAGFADSIAGHFDKARQVLAWMYRAGGRWRKMHRLLTSPGGRTALVIAGVLTGLFGVFATPEPTPAPAPSAQATESQPPSYPAIVQTPPPPPTAEEIAAALEKRLPKPEPAQQKPEPEPPRIEPVPTLVDRYMEQWFPGEQGSLIIYEGFKMPTTVGKRQMFTPAVRAPQSTKLSAVTLAICVPTHFTWHPNREWVLQDTGLCGPNHARYTTYFPIIPRGGGLNPREAFFFSPTEPGEFLVKYWITSAELAPFESYFFVSVAKP